MNEQKYIKISKLAEDLCVTVDTVYKWARKGELSFVQPYNRVRYVTEEEYNRLMHTKKRQRKEPHIVNIVYKITKIETGEYYIGRHLIDINKYPDLNDGYYGAGDKIKKSIQEHIQKAFTREILHQVESMDEALAFEGKYVTEDTLKDPLCMNNLPGGIISSNSKKCATYQKRENMEIQETPPYKAAIYIQIIPGIEEHVDDQIEKLLSYCNKRNYEIYKVVTETKIDEQLLLQELLKEHNEFTHLIVTTKDNYNLFKFQYIKMLLQELGITIEVVN